MKYEIYNRKTGEVLEEVENLVPVGIQRLTQYHRDNPEWFNIQIRGKK